MEFRTAYGPKVKVAIDTGQDGGAKQSFKDECDINRIMKKASKTGVVDWLARNEPRYADVSEYDFMTSMQTIATANEMFAELPSAVRRRFHNEPAELLAFLHDPDNTEEAIRLGLAVAREVPKVPEPMAVRIVSEEKPPGQPAA